MNDDGFNNLMEGDENRLDTSSNKRLNILMGNTNTKRNSHSQIKKNDLIFPQIKMLNNQF